MSQRSSGYAGLLDAVVVVASLPAIGLVTAGAPGSPLRVVAAALLVFFLPGYALTTAVFPARATGRGGGGLRERVTSLGGGREGPAAAAVSDGERAALAVGLSVALTPLFGLVLELLAGGLVSGTTNWVVYGFVLVATAVGVGRRLGVPPRHRFTVSVAGVRHRSQSLLGLEDRRGPQVLDVALGVLMLVAVVTFSYALVAPQQGATYSELYVLSETEGGEFEAINYADTDTGGGEAVRAVVENHEDRSVTYTLVVTYEALEDGTAGSTREAITAGETVAPGERWTVDHRLDPSFDAEPFRVGYHLYVGSPPRTHSRESAYRYVAFTVGTNSA